jgi:uncharacterized coiled-coil protein SlyX
VQNPNYQNKTILYQNERIEELEEALRESVRITAEREYEVADKDSKMKRAEEKINKLMNDIKAMNNVTNATCTNCPPLKVRLDKIESKFKKLLIERNQQLKEMFDMKLEALSAAISEKDAHLAILEMSGINSSQTADEAERLRSQKKILVEKLKIENENRVKLLSETKETLVEIQRTSLSNSKDRKLKEDIEDGLRSLTSL